MGDVVICEKPSQRANLIRALGRDVGTVVAARGHLYDLKEPQEVRDDWARWGFDLLNPGEPYALKSRTGRGLQEVRGRIRDALKHASRVVIATDCDREGHLIGMEILQACGYHGPVLRAMFNAEDTDSLRVAWQNLRPAADYAGLLAAGEARRQADQIVNLSLTRAITKQLMGETRGVLGIGRVKTPTLGIICQREEEIRNFRSEMRWAIRADVAGGANPDCEFIAECRILPGDAKTPITRKELAERIAAAALNWQGPLRVNTKRRTQGPPPPFDLSGLQKHMAARFGWPAKMTADTAQRIYSDVPLITYPRGDARAFPEAMVAEMAAMRIGCAAILGEATIGAGQIRQGARGIFSDKRLEGASHHAIAPNPKTIDEWPRLMVGLGDTETRLAREVMRRFLMVTDTDWVFDAQDISFEVPTEDGNARFRARGKTTIETGWKRWGGTETAANDDREPDRTREIAQTLPDIPDGSQGTVTRTGLAERPTRPPPRFSEGGILEAMRDAWTFLPDGPEKDRLKDAGGIGTPATRDSIIAGLVRQGQVKLDGKGRSARYMPTARGWTLWQILDRHLCELVDPGMTAIWEAEFDALAQSDGADWWDVVEKIADRAAMQIMVIQTLETGCIGHVDTNQDSQTHNRGRRRTEPPASQASGRRGMSGDNTNDTRDMTPSAGKLAFLHRLCAQTGTSKDQLKAGWDSDYRICGDEIDRLKTLPGGNPPTTKQLAAAERVAVRLGIDLPDAVRQDFTQCSQFLDEHFRREG
ncbi:MAG: DNA topoisomerase [Rhodobacteraceae bacterium]|nr:DNA topoisomerase [Paracoccaceae bacterium]